MKNYSKALIAKIKLHALRKKYSHIYKKYSEFTMVGEAYFISNLELIRQYSNIEGAIVECGTWKGGMIAGMAEILNKNKDYYLFDSFEGLPDAKEIDGLAAKEYQIDVDSPWYHDNCTADVSDAETAMSMAGISNCNIVKGWFKDTLPMTNFDKGISILRMDADWYESTMDIFTHLYQKVNSDGLIIIDDYFTWDGCSRAVHDFLSQNCCVERIDSHRGVCYLKKMTSAKK